MVYQDDLPWEESSQGAFFAHRRRRLGPAAGGERIGCSVVELDPGKTGWPFHYHCGNEEAIYVLFGEATLRLGDTHLRVTAGSYIALPAGPKNAHQLTNTSSEPVRYLAISTMRSPDVVVYPDSNKVAAIAGAPPGADGPRDVFAVFPRDAAVGYWDGEPTGAADTLHKEAAATAAAQRAEDERRIDEEIAQMKRRLGAEPSGGGGSPTRDPAPEDDTDALKRKLEQD